MVCYAKTARLLLSTLAPAVSLAGLAFVSIPAYAQTQALTKAAESPTAQRSDPADPKAVTPTLAYQSSLSRYQAFIEPDVAPWRETNEVVGQRGGWRAYAREAREAREPAPTVTPAAAVPAASQPAATVKPTMPGHAGHEMK